MLVCKISKKIPRNILNLRYYSSLLRNEEEYTSTPKYPPILDLSCEKVLERKNEAKHEEIKTVKTIEEKQIKLNMPRYYGFKCYMLKEDNVPYNNLALAQHVTRTHIIETETFPNYYDKIVIDDELINDLKSDISENILLELEGYKRVHNIKKQDINQISLESAISSSISKQINRALTNRLSRTYPHLIKAEVDYDPRIESVWYAGGMKPPENIKKCREGQSWLKHKADDPTNRAMNYIGSANVALRTDSPLLSIIPFEESENNDFQVPFFEYDPRTVGIATENRHIANVPGFWPGDPNQFALLSYHNRGHLLKRYYNDPIDDKEAVHRIGILASFAWLNAQANFLGFNSFNDVTYPLVTQTVVTNGKIWSFYVYQLNTILLHSKYININPKRNICWATPELKLFDSIENGKLIGFNDDVLKCLIKFYGNVPEDRLGVNMRPYLSEQEKVTADYEDVEKREWLEREYKYLVANRPRFKTEYEIYHWEKIYKIDHETRFMEARRRPFELKINPWRRTLDDRKPRYIPRVLRPDLPKHKGRDAKEYFP